MVTLVSASFSVAFAEPSDSERLMDLFTKAFNDPNFYQCNRCGQNILNLVDAAHREGIPLKNAVIINLAHRSHTELDQVVALKARTSGTSHSRFAKAQPTSPPSTRGWAFHHTILDVDGKIFDFDFMNEPRVLPTEKYLKEMFFDGLTSSQIQTKLKDYRVELLPALPASERAGMIGEPIEMTFDKYIKFNSQRTGWQCQAMFARVLNR